MACCINSVQSLTCPGTQSLIPYSFAGTPLLRRGLGFVQFVGICPRLDHRWSRTLRPIAKFLPCAEPNYSRFRPLVVMAAGFLPDGWISSGALAFWGDC